MIRIGVSGCLLGQHVRYDGGHRRTESVVALVAPPVELVVVCPETEAGFGVPRPPMHLAHEGAETVVRITATGRDVSGTLRAWIGNRLSDLPTVDGWILKARSPSCGINNARLVGSEDFTSGVFAAAILRTGIPAIDEQSASVREHAITFIDAVVDGYERRSGRSASPIRLALLARIS